MTFDEWTAGHSHDELLSARKAWESGYAIAKHEVSKRLVDAIGAVTRVGAEDSFEFLAARTFAIRSMTLALSIATTDGLDIDEEVKRVVAEFAARLHVALPDDIEP